MRAARIHAFGPPDVILVDDVPKPTPGAGEVLVSVRAAGVGPWDGWIRIGKSALPQKLPLTLGSDIAGAGAVHRASERRKSVQNGSASLWESAVGEPRFRMADEVCVTCRTPGSGRDESRPSSVTRN